MDAEPLPSGHADHDAGSSGRGGMLGPGAAPGHGGARALGVAEELLATARREINEHHTDQARDLLDRCDRAMPSAADGEDAATVLHLRIRLELARAWVAFEEEGLARAVALVERWRAVAVAEGLTDLIAACDLQLGTVFGRSGSFASALDALNRAEQSRLSMSTVDQARLLLNRGSLLSHLQQPSKAVTDFAEATALAQSAGQEALAFMAAHNEGYAEFLQGDVPRALRLMERADALDVEVDRGIARLDRARVLLEAGLVDEAYEVLQTAAEAVASQAAAHDLGEIELGLARCEILRGHRHEAGRLAIDAGERFRGRGETGWARIAEVIGLEATVTDRDTAEDRERLSAALQRAAAADGDRWLQQRAGLLRAEACIDQGDIERAREHLDQSRGLTRSPQLATRLHTRYVAARIYDRAGHRASAVRTLRRAADDLGSAGRAAAGLDLRTALTVHAAALIALDMELAMRGGSPARVLSRTELWRDVVRTQPPLRISDDPRRAEAIAGLRQLREDQRQAPPGEQSLRATQEVSKAERRVRELDWTTASTTGAAAGPRGPMSAAAIRTAVRGAGVTLLSTLRVGGRVHAVMVRPDGRASLHTLGALAGLRDDVRSVRADLSTAARLPEGHPFHSIVRASLLRGLGELETLLLQPVHAAGLADSPLVVIPTPTLTTLPWGMFPSRRGLATTVARSATGWARGHTRMGRQPQVYAVAGPDVPLANREVESIVRAWGSGQAVPATGSTVTGLLDALKSSDLVHVAAHGDHNTQNPLFSSLRLCDGPAFAHEIEGHRLRATHVVLSACDGGRVSVRRGDEPLGMTASLLALGVSSVVAAVSPVPDAVAHEVMAHYHANLAGGQDVSGSLAGAITAVDDVLAGAFTAYGSYWSAVPPAAEAAERS